MLSAHGMFSMKKKTNAKRWSDSKHFSRLITAMSNKLEKAKGEKKRKRSYEESIAYMRGGQKRKKRKITAKKDSSLGSDDSGEWMKYKSGKYDDEDDKPVAFLRGG